MERKAKLKIQCFLSVSYYNLLRNVKILSKNTKVFLKNAVNNLVIKIIYVTELLFCYIPIKGSAMAEFNVQQKATIDNYRTARNLGFVLTDEAVAELIKKEIEQSGTVYPGFEILAKSVVKSKVKQPFQVSPSPVKPTTSIFGSEIIGDDTDPFSIERTTQTNSEFKLTQSQNEAINFLKDLTGKAEKNFKSREDESGVLSGVVNTWQEVFNKQYAKSTVKKELKSAKEDLRLLEQAGKGQLGYTDFLGNEYIKSFEDVFKQRRGVKFDEKAIAYCTERAEYFATIKTSVEMINQTKQTLAQTTRGDIHSQMNPQEASGSIIKAFQLSGINSLKEMNNTLKDIEAKYKDHPDIQKYGGEFRFAKNKQGQYVIYRTAKNGYPAEATNEELRIIAKEMGLRLDKALATALGVEYSENATAEEMANLTQQTYDKYQKEYEDSFAKAYGKKDVKALAETYVLKQQQGVANIEMGLNIASMALMVVPGGAVATGGWALKGALAAKHTATGTKVVKGLQLVDRAKTFVKGAQTMQKLSQTASPFIMANMTLRPTELLEQITSKNGMSDEEWKAWGEGVLQNSVYMAAGMGASKLAETGAAMYKTKALVHTLKSAGKSTDEIMAMIKANPVKFPNEIVKNLNKVDNLAKTLQVTSEVALDIGSTVLVNKVLGNGDLLSQDVINSIAFAISGGVLQRQFAPLSTEAKVSFIQNLLKEYGINKVEAERILKTMDDISAGKLRAKDIKPLDDNSQAHILDEVTVTGNKNGNKISTTHSRLAMAKSREDFAAIRDEIKAMPNGPEKQAMAEEYTKAYSKWSSSPKRPDIRMEYKPDASKDDILNALQQFGASDKQIMDFQANCSDEVISYIESRISASDFNPLTENYFIHLNRNNVSLLKELAADTQFPKEQLNLVANAAYTQNFVNQIRKAYKNGADIIPGCQRVVQMKAAQEARMNDAAVTEKKQSWDNAVKRLAGNTSLSKQDINELANFGNIRETSIQDLIIHCEKNGIKNYHNVLYRCSENMEGDNLSPKEIEARVGFARKGLENNISTAELSNLLWEYEKYSPEEMEAKLNTQIEEVRIENEKRLAKENAITNTKNSLLEKYNSGEVKEIFERIINKENLPENLLNSLDEILGENPNIEQCRYLEKCIFEIKPEKFSLESFKRNFEAGLKKTDLTSVRDSKWQSRPNAKNVILTQEYLSSLKDENGKPVFNQRAVESLLENGKTNPELVKEVVDMAVEKSYLRAPAVIEPLLEATAVDKDMAFSILSMKKNNGEPRFDMLELCFVLDSFKSKLPLVKETFNLEKLYDMDIDASGLLLRAESVEDVRTQFSYQYCRILEGMKKSDGFPMYHSYWDIQDGIQQALIDNPELTLYYVKKNVPDERTAYDGKVIKALNNIAQKSAELEKSFRQELENIKNDENRIQRDNVLSKIKAFAQIEDFDNALKIYEHRDELGLGNKISSVLEKADNISYENLVYLRDVLSKERISQMPIYDLFVASEFAHLAKASNLNEIPIEGKRNLLRNLISANSDLFRITDELAKDFPMLPRNQEQYCEILPAIVRSLGIETTPLDSSKVKVFNKDLNKLSETLTQISDKEFASLHITQEFSKDDFIKTVLEKAKDLSHNERQKVFDYFGFEINKNKGNKTMGYSITGYPINLNNGKKLAQITDTKTQAVVENLRTDVIRFSENNRIKCENPSVEKLLNDIAEVLPEIRTAIGKTQHDTHDYDIMQHSLKVMQKISQDPKFKTLNESDQKIMFLASILHDITKREGFSDIAHANNGSFDTFFIAKKFNLTRAEEIKLYTLIKHHEWLSFVNTSKNQEQLTRHLQSVAYDLQHDNLFDMALIFTHADLKAVKKDDSFHDRTDGENRTTLEGTQRSYGASADVYAKRLKGMVAELQKSQPLLPVTKIPSSGKMKQSVTTVNSDGSTNIKGVYIDKDGLMIIKFNEVEDWEALGFPQGTTSRGVAAKGLNGRGQECDVETGNIKFFAHALDYANQLAKFDAFGLVDSDVLLSVSYAERPESKFRFFRAQGVLLNVETKYIHGGGNTDSGSGCGKSIQNFKDRYIFGGERESDRLYISNMIKEATGLNDSQYVDFVKANENRSFTEIEPVEYREKIIKAFATINSNVRKGNREYNEMYASNPEVMAVFAYSKDNKNSVGQPVSFVDSNAYRLDFLRKFALESDIPMIVFGD